MCQFEDEERLAQEIETHIACLQKLKADMAARELIRARQVQAKTCMTTTPRRKGGGADVACAVMCAV